MERSVFGDAIRKGNWLSIRFLIRPLTVGAQGITCASDYLDRMKKTFHREQPKNPTGLPQ